MADPGTYAVTVKVKKAVQTALKTEQARRVILGVKKPTLNELASELLTKASEQLAK
jgi:hypothetical protein